MNYDKLMWLSLAGMAICSLSSVALQNVDVGEQPAQFSYKPKVSTEKTIEADVDTVVENLYFKDKITRLLEDEEAQKAQELLAQQQKESERLKTLKDNKYYQSYEKQKEENPDTVGWINFSNVSICYPIMWSANNDYYLTHNPDKQEDDNGSIALDASSNGNWGMVNLINGHNMRSGKMFGLLDYYKQEKYCKEHKDIMIIREGSIATYRVFSVFLTESTTESLRFSADNKKELKLLLKTLSNRSLHELEYDKNAEDLIILNTCSYEYSNAHLLLCAYKIAEEVE